MSDPEMNEIYALPMLKHAWAALIWWSVELVHIGCHGLS